MSTRHGRSPILTLEPLLEAVRSGVEEAGWELSGLQKTTSHEFEGRWAGVSTRSAYLFFHRADLPEAISVEGFLDETSDGLKGNLTLVVEGPCYGDLGKASTVLDRVASATLDTFPSQCRVPLSLRLHLPRADTPPERAQVQLRVRVHLPPITGEVSHLNVSRYTASAVGAFEAMLERPEVAEFLPPVVE